MEEIICQAIRERRLIQFHYAAGDEPGVRVVEPHMVARNRGGRLALSAWFVRGKSESAEGEGWREYLVRSISAVTLLDETFPGPRPGYKADGGKRFRNVRCAL